MPYLRQLSCVAAILLAGAAGCVAADPGKMAREPAGQPNAPPDRTVPGPLDRVNDMMKASLSELNVLHFSVRENGAIRFDCRTPNNARFCLILVDATAKGHDPQTRIHVGWEHDREREDGLSDPVVVAILNRVSAKAAEEQRRKEGASR
jgi:hypothetical protein